MEETVRKTVEETVRKTLSMKVRLVLTSGATLGTTATHRSRGVDVATARRPSRIRESSTAPPVIPASHIKGRLRHEVERVLRALDDDRASRFGVCSAPSAAGMCTVPRVRPWPDGPFAEKNTSASTGNASERSRVSSGERSQASSGERSRVSSGERSQASSGERSQTSSGAGSNPAHTGGSSGAAENASAESPGDRAHTTAGDDGACPVCQLFGNPWQAGRLRFSDAEAILPDPRLVAKALERKPGVSISRKRRVAEDERLFFIERVPGGVHFEAEIQGSATLAEAALLAAVFTRTVGWGRAKSRGSGWARAECLVTLDGRTLTAAELNQGLEAWRPLEATTP